MSEFNNGETVLWSDEEMEGDSFEVQYVCPSPVIPGFHLVIFDGSRVMVSGDSLSKVKPVEIEAEDDNG